MAFKLLVLSALVAAAFAAPSVYHHHSLPVVDVHPEYHVSKIVEHIPTAVSHQSRIDYHSKPVITPILAPVVKTYHAPLVHHEPLLHSAPLYHHSPVVHSAPLLHSSPWLDAHAWK